MFDAGVMGMMGMNGGTWRVITLSMMQVTEGEYLLVYNVLMWLSHIVWIFQGHQLITRSMIYINEYCVVILWFPSCKLEKDVWSL
jgi:hypothetical protein